MVQFYMHKMIVRNQTNKLTPKKSFAACWNLCDCPLCTRIAASSMTGMLAKDYYGFSTV
jgi:hypothetical protein